MYPKNMIGIIGCGRMGSLLAKKLSQRFKVFIYDHNPQNTLKVEGFRNIKITNLENLRNTDLIILALSTEVIPEMIKKIEKFINEETLLVNIATTLSSDDLDTKLRVISAKFIGHAKEIALGENPLIIVNEYEPRVIEVFSILGNVTVGNTELVNIINTTAAKFGIIAALEIKEALKELNLSEEVITTAIRNVAAGTMKAFAVGDVGPFARKIVEDFKKDKNT